MVRVVIIATTDFLETSPDKPVILLITLCVLAHVNFPTILLWA